MNLVLCYIVAAATEVTSNTAICSLMMPILSELVRLIERKDCLFGEKKNSDKILPNLFDIYLKHIFSIKESEVLDEIY